MKEVSTAFVLDIINRSDKIEVSQEQLKDSLPELGMDSITFIQIVVALEEEFECEIPDEKLLITEMDTVQKMLDVLQSIYANQDNST
ncbi:MAG: acyl carrier protein [Clostridia bacterium]|nr:acyl carrier protein [Clostridia bacterium]